MRALRYRPLACLLSVLLLLVSAGPVLAGAPALANHRAFYQISLNSSREGVGPTAATGLMAYEFSDSCDRWITDNRIVLDVVYGEEAPVQIDWSFSSWETKDGREYGYHMTHKRNGQVEEQIRGAAKLDGAKGGSARFEGDPPTDMTLAPGTLFPTAHLIAALKAAMAGKKTFARPLFDGGSLDNPYDVNVFLITPKTRGTKARDLLAKAGFAIDLPVWRYQAAFFPEKSKEGTPAFELDVDYRADGVAERIVQTFADFSILMTPVRYEKIKGGC